MLSVLSTDCTVPFINIIQIIANDNPFYFVDEGMFAWPWGWPVL